MTAVAVSFAADGAFQLEYDDPQGSRIKLRGEYEVDFSKTPTPLSIRNIPSLQHPLHTIIQFDGADVLRIGRFAPRWRLRPIAFESSAETLVVRRSHTGADPKSS